MTYKLTIRPRATYLHAVVIGQNTKENVKEYLEELRGECLARNCFRVLIEERLEGPRLNTVDVFEIVMEASRKVHGMMTAIAHVDVNADPEMMHFAETVAVNRSLPVSVFRTVAEAEGWLQNRERAPGAAIGSGDGEEPGR